MANKENIKEVKVLQKTVGVDNSLDADRKCDIKANIMVGDNGLMEISSGEVFEPGQDAAPVATFNKWQSGTLNVQFNANTGSSNASTLMCIEDFVSDCVAYASK